MHSAILAAPVASITDIELAAVMHTPTLFVPASDEVSGRRRLHRGMINW
jgi:hypothetical protein